MKKAALIIIIILVLALGGVSAYVAMIDWNEHKDKIAARFSEVTGKKVVFEGPVSFTIFPAPDLTASNIKVYNTEGEYQNVPLATVKSLVAKLALMPLLRGNFEVKMMSLIEPDILVDVDDQGKLNWQSSISEEQKLNLENIEISLDSVLLEKANLNFVNIKRDVNVKLENLNAEVIAPSLFGPYRIEGSYIKDNNPEGFAMSLGQFSESFATSVNFVLNHPASQTFVRFDGTLLLKNDALNGNLVIDSKEPVNFVNKNFKHLQLGDEYDYPLALSMQVDTNKTKIGLTNIVVKYGTTAGAGNVLIPLADEFADEEEPERPKVEIAFEMTDLDLKPVAAVIKTAVEKYKAEDAIYKPELNFDFIADLKAINTTYNDQNIKEFSFSADYTDNALMIGNLSAILPGETVFKTTGEVFSSDDKLTYILKPNYTTVDLKKLLAWMGYQADQVTQATYKRSSGSATIEGNLKNIKVAPFDLSIDKSAFQGNLGLIAGERSNVYLEVNGDNVNFDNYIKPLPKEELQKSFAERMNYRFANLAFLNDFDLRVVGKLGLGIYEGVPFENTQLDFDVVKGAITVSKLNIGSVAGAAAEASGVIRGLGETPKFENFKYMLSSSDLSAFLNKFEVSLPDVNLKNLKKFNSKGIATGSLEKMVMKTVSKLEYIDVVYAGQAEKQNGKWMFNGALDVRAPDFVQLVNDFNFNYKPKTFSLGIFNLSSKISGDIDKMRFSEMNVFAGSNNFRGDVLVDRGLGRPNIQTTLSVNKFEFDRFFYNNQDQGNKAAFRGNETAEFDFMAKPYVDKTKINYDFYKKFDFNGKLNFGSLSYRGREIKDARVELDLQGGVINLRNADGVYNGGRINGNFELGMTEQPSLRGSFGLQDQQIIDRAWSGRKYGIKSGKYNAQLKLSTLASSQEEMLSNLDGEISFLIDNPLIKGWNFAVISEDLKKRDRSEGFAALVQENLQSGETLFSKAAGTIKLAKSRYEFINAELISEAWNIKMKDTGNLTGWDMDAEFTAEMVGDKKQPFTFTLSGSMESPILTVDVKNITDGYDAFWAKIAADKKTAEETRKAYLQSLMDEQMQYAKNVQQRLFKEIVPELESRRQLTKNELVLEKYKGIDDRVKNISKGLDEVIVQKMVPDFDESLPKALGAKNAALDDRSAGLKDEILRIYADDLKQRINGIYNMVVDDYNQSKKNVNDYRSRYGEFAKRLAKIKTMLDIDKDTKILALKKEIEERLLALDAINSAAVKDYIYLQNIYDYKRLEKYANKITEKEKKSAIDLQELDARIAELFGYTENLVSAEENAYFEYLKQEEIKKKLEENTGKISGSSGKNITVTRSIQEIEKLEAAKQKEEIPVLDFSDKTSTPSEGETVTEDIKIKNWRELKPVKQEPIISEIDVKVEVEKIPLEADNATLAPSVTEPVEAKSLLIKQDSVLRKASGEAIKASGKIMREDD